MDFFKKTSGSLANNCLTWQVAIWIFDYTMHMVLKMKVSVFNQFFRDYLV